MAWTNLFTAPRNLSVLGGFPLVSPQSDLRLSAHTNGGPQREGGEPIPGIKLSSAAAAAHIHMNIKVNSRSDAGLCVGNCDAQGIT